MHHPGQHDGVSDVIPEIVLNYREIRRYLQRLSGVVRLDRESGRNPEQYPLLYFRFARKGGPATATVRKSEQGREGAGARISQKTCRDSQDKIPRDYGHGHFQTDFHIDSLYAHAMLYGVGL